MSVLDEIGKFRFAHCKSNVAAPSERTLTSQRATYATVELDWEADDLLLSSLQSVNLGRMIVTTKSIPWVIGQDVDIWSKLDFIIVDHLIRKTFVVEVEVDMGLVLAHFSVTDWLNLNLVSDHRICVFKPIYVFIEDIGHNLSVWNHPLEREVVRRSNFWTDRRNSKLAQNPVRFFSR